MLPVAVGIAVVFLGFFLWSVRNGDHEDPEMIKYRMIYDDADDADRSLTSDNIQNESAKADQKLEDYTDNS